MFAIETVIAVVLFLIGCAAIFGLLFAAASYCEKEFPSTALFMKFARLFLFLAMVFVLIGLILDLMGHPIISWRRS